jgi:predicted nucleic acid-binding protein
VEKTLASGKALVNTVIVMELAHFLVKNLGPVTGKKKLETFLEFPMTIIDLDFEQMRDAINLLCEYSHVGIGGRDATLLAAMKKIKTNKIMTHDIAFKKIDWLKIIDPIH